jgi:hypothetical protein
MSSYSSRVASSHHQHLLWNRIRVDPLNNFDDAMTKTVRDEYDVRETVVNLFFTTTMTENSSSESR